jgi:hypothetical protein
MHCALQVDCRFGIALLVDLRLLRGHSAGQAVGHAEPPPGLVQRFSRLNHEVLNIDKNKN